MYLSKAALLKSYMLLSGISAQEENSQGVTQRVSVLRYFIATDSYLHTEKKNVPLSASLEEQKIFCAAIGRMVGLDETHYISDFRETIKESDWKFNAGSNFFSTWCIQSDKTIYPSRGGWTPLLMKEGGYFKPTLSAYDGVLDYLHSVEIRTAFALWMCRGIDLNEKSLYAEVVKYMSVFQTSEFVKSVIPCEKDFTDVIDRAYGDVGFQKDVAILGVNDLVEMFHANPRKDTDPRWHLLFAECQRVNGEWMEDWHDRYRELIEDVRAVEEFDEAMFRRLIVKKQNGICSYGRGAIREEFFAQLIQDINFLAALKNFRANRSVETFNELAAAWKDFSDRVKDKQHPILLNRLAAALGTDVSCVGSNSDFMSIWDKLVAAKLIDLKRSPDKNWFADNLELVRFIDAQIKDCDGYDEYNRNIFIWMLKDLPISEIDEKKTCRKTEIRLPAQKAIDGYEDFIEAFRNDADAAGLKYNANLVKRFVCALLAKPFVVLTGLSGSGKTKLAQAFAEWIAVEGTSCIVSVGADWTNSEKMLGYPNGLDPENYILPDSGVLKLMIDANDNPNVPFFLILDEMNLSHVERYFADFLSAMESKGRIKLYDGAQRTASNGTPIPQEIDFPPNLFVIGTMNVDETTHAFSPKVLDRAQVIEFRVTPDEMKSYLASSTVPDVKKLSGKGTVFAEAFKKLHDAPLSLTAADKKAIADALNKFFPDLAELGSEFAYRTAGEAVAFCAFARSAGMSMDEAIDAAIMQKLLPKLHGSRRRLALPLETFWGFCRKDDRSETLADLFKKDSSVTVQDVAKYPISAEKIRRLYKAVESNGFASYAEA